MTPPVLRRRPTRVTGRTHFTARWCSLRLRAGGLPVSAAAPPSVLDAVAPWPNASRVAEDLQKLRRPALSPFTPQPSGAFVEARGRR